MALQRILIFAGVCLLAMTVQMHYAAVEAWFRAIGLIGQVGLGVGALTAFYGYLRFLGRFVGHLFPVKSVPVLVWGSWLAGKDGSGVVVIDRKSGRRIAFTKQLVCGNGARYRMVVATSHLLESDLGAIQQALHSAGIASRLENGDGRTKPGLLVECDDDPDRAITAARIVLIDVFGLNPEGTVQVKYHGKPHGCEARGWGEETIRQHPKPRSWQ